MAHMIHEVSLLMGFNKASAIIFYVSRLGFKGQDGLKTYKVKFILLQW